MKSLQEFSSSVDFVLTDIDDTLTDEGQLGPDAYGALWKLSEAGIHVVPITGRPAGWCEMISRQWPVAGVVGENGGFYFRYHGKKMHRAYRFDELTLVKFRAQLQKIKEEILAQVPGCAVASDQFCRQMDLAIDFCEDVPALSPEAVQQIVKIFNKHGAIAKISSIHVNGWFGEYDKKSTALQFLKNEFGLNESAAKQKSAYCGDSPNDEPMFAAFPHSFGVANVQNFAHSMKNLPTYVSGKQGGAGFAEIAERILASRKKV